MTDEIKGDTKEVTPPVLPPELNEDGTVKSAEDIEIEKELAKKETEVIAKPQRTALEKAEFNAKSNLKRYEELGGNPADLLGGEKEPKEAEKPSLDTSNFVTKTDLLRGEAEKLARTPTEAKLIMWYVENKGLTISEAHLLANKGRISKLDSEINRSRTAIPSNIGGGAGQRSADTIDAPELAPEEKRSLLAAGMVYDASKKAYVGKKIQHRFDETSKQWMTEKIAPTPRR